MWLSRSKGTGKRKADGRTPRTDGRTEVPIQDSDGPLRILRSLDLPVT